jgi:hypothetical protein
VRVEVRGDELFVVIDAVAVSGLLERKVSHGALAAGLPGQAARLADAAADMLTDPRPQQPRTIGSITVRLVETRVIAEETLMLDKEREVFT